MDFSCKQCGYTVTNIPKQFWGKRVKCHQCLTVQRIPVNDSPRTKLGSIPAKMNKPPATPALSKKPIHKTLYRLSIGASIVLFAAITIPIIISGKGYLEKSSTIQLIVDVVLPVFGIMLAGYLSGVFGILGVAATEALNRYVFFIALPALFTISMSRVPLGKVVIMPFLAAFCGGLAITFITTLVLGHTLFHERTGINSLRAASAVFANTGYMGIPLFMLLFGETGLLPAVLSAVFLGVVVTAALTVMLELDRGRNSKQGNLIKRVVYGVSKSPLLISAAAGLTFSAAGIEMPKAAATFCETLGASAGPCALFAIGLFMVGRPISNVSLEVFWLTGMKLIIQPLITAWLAFKVLVIDPKMASAAVILSALPVGSLVFVLAQQYKLYVHRATSVILISTVMSVLTLSLLFIVLGLSG